MTENVCEAMSFMSQLMMVFGPLEASNIKNPIRKTSRQILLASLLALFPKTKLLFSHLLCWLCEKSSTEWIKVFKWWWEDRNSWEGRKKRSMQAVGLLSLNLQNSFFTTYILSTPTPKHLCCELPNCLVMWF